MRTSKPGSSKQASNAGANYVAGGDCECGARRVDLQLGLERTPDEYVAKLVAVFAEVRRALRPDGTLWLNLGDSYAANGASGLSIKGETSTLVGSANVGHVSVRKAVPGGLKPKDLVGIPWRVAFALQADGWYLRSDIIWSKPNPIPEGVTDRPTKAHEYLFLLAKSERYYYDAEAIAEPYAESSFPRYAYSIMGNPKEISGGGRPNRASNTAGIKRMRETGRNARTVWTITTQPFRDAHFAVMPENLVRPCVLAGCPDGGTVLDPFSGSGTVGVVALREGRSFVGIDLNPTYVEMARRRINDVAPMFVTVESETA